MIVCKDIRLPLQRDLAQREELWRNRGLSDRSKDDKSSRRGGGGGGRTDVTLLGTLGQQHDPLALSPHPCRSPGTMTKHLGIRRWIILNDDVDVGEIEPSGGDVRA